MAIIKTKAHGSVLIGFNPIAVTNKQGKKVTTVKVIKDIYGDNT